jgi:hypothetical protein
MKIEAMYLKKFVVDLTISWFYNINFNIQTKVY